MDDNRPVLVVGGTGHLGGRVVVELLGRGRAVRALVRPTTDASKLQAQGVEVVRGDMLDLDSLLRAMDGVDAVITTAAGYTRRDKNAKAIDTIGQANLAEAAHRTGVRRFVLTSILTCDQTPQVPHFWNKKLAEDKLEELGVPFVALRPGAFLDQLTQFGDPFVKGRVGWFGNTRVPLTFVLMADLAGYLVDAVDAPGVEGERIDIGWDRPVSMRQIARIASRQHQKEFKVRAIPGLVIHTLAATIGRLVPMIADIGAMLRWFESGKYVADPTRQGEVFGEPPTAEDALARFAEGLGHGVKG